MHNEPDKNKTDTSKYFIAYCNDLPSLRHIDTKPFRSFDAMVCEALLIKYGRDAQYLKLIEECGELIRIISKRLNNLEEATNDNIIHEIVDVMVMITQMHCIFDRKKLSSAYHHKLQELVVKHGLKI